MLDKLYSQIGTKIKRLAMWTFMVEAIGAIIVGLIFLIDSGFEDGWWALLIILFGPIVAFVGSWLLYGFGEIIDKLSDIERNTKFTYNDEARQEYEINEIARQEALEKARQEAEEERQRAEAQRQEAAQKRQEKAEQIKDWAKDKIDTLAQKTEAEKKRELAKEASKHGETLIVKANKFGDAICPCCNTNLYFEGNGGFTKCSKCKCSLKIER